jgi:hypothetical protein
LQGAAGMAGQLYDQGQPSYYPGQAVTPFGADTQNALSMTRGLAMGPGAQLGSNILGNYGSTLGGDYLKGYGGMSNLARTAGGDYLKGYGGMSNLARTAGGDYLKAYGGLSNLARTAGGNYLKGHGGLSNLARVAGGGYLHGGSGFNAAMDAAARDIQPRIQSMFGRSGRHNSGLAQAAATQELGDVFAGLYGDERNRQMQASGALANLYGSERALQAQASGALAGLYGDERARQVQASGALSGLYGNERNRQMQALAMGPQMEQLAYAPAARLAQVGGTLEGKRGEEIAADRARYDYGAMGPQRQFDAYLQRLQGIQPGTTQTQTNPLYSNPAAGAVGGAMTGLGLAQGLGSMPFFGAGGAGAAMAPWLAPAGLGLGLLGGLL